MPLARVVAFEGVSTDRMAEMQRDMQGNERPENVPAKEIVVLHDPVAEKSLVILFFMHVRWSSRLTKRPRARRHASGKPAFRTSG